MKRLVSVKASAGSGKTFTLASRYVSLLFKSDPSKIMAVTFTNKAVIEMKERVLKFLKTLDKDQAILNAVSNESGLSQDEILRKRDKLLEKFLKDSANITTIDSFLHKILKKFGYYVGFGGGFDVKQSLNDEFFKLFLHSLKDYEFNELLKLSKEAEETKKLSEFFEKLYSKDRELMGLSFSGVVKKPNDSKARAEFEKLKKHILNHNLSSSSAKKAIDIDFENIIGTTWIAKKSLSEYQYFKKKGLYEPWFEDVLGVLQGYFKEYLRYKEQLFFQKVFKYYDRYKDIKSKYKKKNSEISHEDVPVLVDKILTDKFDREFLYFRLDGKVEHILIDEFQDTSVTQWKIFEPMVDEITSTDEKSFFYVGDVKQAIYRFRGGQRELFDYVAKRYVPNGLLTEVLDTNYRSDKNIVEFVNKVFNLNEKAKLEDEGYVELDVVNNIEQLDKIYEKIELLNKNGVKDKDIAILVYSNDKGAQIAEFLESKGRSVSIHSKIKVTEQPFASAVISALKFIDNPKMGVEKLNFLSTIGEKWDENFFVGVEKGLPFFMISSIIKRYDLVDESTLKLLEFSRGFKSLKRFLKEVERYDETLSVGKNDGIVIMTIHSSKGLEFDHLIVVDGGKEQEKERVIFYYDDVKLKGLYFKENRDIKNLRALIDFEYANVVNYYENATKIDSENVEYVAYTRAKHSLIILKNDKSTRFEKLGSLEPFIQGKIKVYNNNEDTQKQIVTLTLKNYGKQDVKVKEDKKAYDFKSIYLGNAIHYYYECKDLEAVRNIYGDFVDMEIVQNAKKIDAILGDLGIKDFEIDHEVPYISNGNLKRADLVVKAKDSIYIIDFKSSKPDDLSGYKEQVNGYKIDFKELQNCKDIRGFLYFVKEDEILEV